MRVDAAELQWERVGPSALAAVKQLEQFEKAAASSQTEGAHSEQPSVWLISDRVAVADLSLFERKMLEGKRAVFCAFEPTTAQA